MSYEEVIETYRIEDICPEIENELNGMFVDILGDDFEIGIFPEQSTKTDDAFVVTVEIACEDATLDSTGIQLIKSSVEERLSHNVGDDWKVAQKKFDGVQIFFNDELIS